MADEVKLIDAKLLSTNIAQIAKNCARSDAQKALIGRILYMIENMPTIETEPVHENPENGNKKSEQYCHDCKHNEVCKYYPHNGCDFKEKAEGWIDDESMENEDMRPDNEVI